MTNYKDIISNNAEQYCGNYKWWAYNAFHYTNLDNAVNILKSGFLYSRSQSSKNNLMQNDNASRKVIDITDPVIVNYARFYFRPLTPTQYYNEGYKHPQLRYSDDIYANVPIPIFFVFDLNTLISDNNTLFSERSQAGLNTPDLLAGVENFKNLSFNRIYENGPMANPDEDKKFRQAEILYPEKYKIEKSLKYIFCRNEIERATLLHILKGDNIAYSKYKDIVRIGKENLFYNNGLNISEVNYYQGNLQLLFQDNFYSRNKYAKSLMERNNIDKINSLNAELILTWKTFKGDIVDKKWLDYEFDYFYTSALVCKIPCYKHARILEIELRVMNELMCYIDRFLDENQIF